jgi:ATP-dependent DNA helicase RecQ
MSSDSDSLLVALRRLTGNPVAQFHAGQREAIESLVVQRDRLVLVQRTGWGKSAVYFVATRLLRDERLGATLLISPLLALMRNQIDAAERLGLRTYTINSSSENTVAELISLLETDAVDLVVISPERLANPEFADQVMPLIGGRPGLTVVDEVHCISDWGHDFRPDYRRIGRMLSAYPEGMPILGCTATANNSAIMRSSSAVL